MIRKFIAGPKMWQWASHAFGGSLVFGFVGFGSGAAMIFVLNDALLV